MNALMYFGPRIFEVGGPSTGGMPADYFQNVMNLVNFLATFPAIVLTERIGRRRLLLGGAAGMALSCLAIASGSHHAQIPVDELLPGAALVPSDSESLAGVATSIA